MPIYVYETIPARAGEKTRRFELQQRMADPPLKTDPETGLPVRRVITGGLEIPRGASSPKPAPTGHRHGPSCSCCG